MEHPVHKVVIIGAGHAGGTLATTLRQYKFEGEVTLLGDEGRPPYQRPPLSKAWLMGEVEEKDLFLKPHAYYTDNRIDLHVDESVTQIDRHARLVTTASGRKFSYDVLVFATGARARTTEVLDCQSEGVVTLRDMKDASTLRERAKQAKNVVIVGGGYIGLEAAASISKLGASVSIVERDARLLSRAASQAIADALQTRHESAGVRFFFGTTVIAVERDGLRVRAVRLENGQTLDCDLLLVGMGVIPNDALAHVAGIACDGGILVNTESASSDPRVFAIGDVAVHCASRFGATRRVESISNAVDQAKQVAAQIVGRPVPRLDVPWFWSDQYELKVQMAGLPNADSTALTRTSTQADGTTVLYMSGDQIVGVETINRPRDFMVARTAISRGQRLNLDIVREPDAPLASALLQS
ncbi:NAD(P)/FAD-dependent oxidoreductase [Caballeronia zhejiangensis]|uniref:NAD(P)/FAD-dependent oxidoreductase n=1 Tax=Caballeronia zhejiangensis TaxID=871203 RepID=UPI001F52882E|nr:FAD-dependent oxidoreductase [Caballeronia zhejiangensis]MCI1047032.1 FAD-dependent oxidoreductase [Caballeronia zhejiangensis]